MKATFDIGGYEIEVNTSGGMTSRDGLSGCGGSGVGIQIHRVFSLGPDRTDYQCLLQSFLKPSEARAIASALLSAATERGTREAV